MLRRAATAFGYQARQISTSSVARVRKDFWSAAGMHQDKGCAIWGLSGL